MLLPSNIIATADDLGISPAVNKAILFCFEHGYINSTSFLVNTPLFEETVHLIHADTFIHTIGVHINLTEGAPVSRFKENYFLNEQGNWDIIKVSKKHLLNSVSRAAFYEEISAQISKALASGIAITHLDSHHHIHTHPQFYRLFINAARQYGLKLRIAQTYSEGNVTKFLYRRYINSQIKKGDLQFSDYFGDVNYFLKKNPVLSHKRTEIMLHPTFDAKGNLSDHYDPKAITGWIDYLKSLE